MNLIFLLSIFCLSLLLGCGKIESNEKSHLKNDSISLVAILYDNSDVMLEHICYEMLKINVQIEAKGRQPFYIYVSFKDKVKAIQYLKSDKWLVGKKIKIYE